MTHGRSKEERDAVLDQMAADLALDDRATLSSSTDRKKTRLVYGTADFRRWEAAHA